MKRSSVDHLVVLATDLEQGVAWCQATLGIAPGAGGAHPLMGTHNRLLSLASSGHPTAYLEIIAIDTAARPLLTPGHARWFDMDDPALQARVALHGPQLVHFVAGVADIAAGVAALAIQGIDRGVVLPASRETPTGLLQWQISVRNDGQRLFDGCLPTLIQWGDRHPTQTMAASGIALEDLQVFHPTADTLRDAYHALDLSSVSTHTGPAQIRARLRTPKGLVSLHS